MRVERFAFSQIQCCFFGRREVRAIAEVGKVLDLFLAPSVPLCQSGMRAESILAVVQLRCPDDDQLLKLLGDAPGLHDGTEMRDHRA